MNLVRIILFVTSLSVVYMKSSLATEARSTDANCFSFQKLGSSGPPKFEPTIFITKYDISCGKKVIIPTHIGNNKVVLIGHNSLSDRGLTDIDIPDDVSFYEDSISGNPAVAYAVVNYKSLPNELWKIQFLNSSEGVSIDSCENLLKTVNEKGGFFAQRRFLDLGQRDTGFYFDESLFKKVTFFQKCSLPNGDQGALIKPLIGMVYTDYEDVTFTSGIEFTIQGEKYWGYSEGIIFRKNELSVGLKTISATYGEQHQQCSVGTGGNGCIQYPYHEQINFIKTIK